MFRCLKQRPFAGSHTADKLGKLEAYLEAYLTVLKKQDWVHTIYFDAFAGTGTAPIAISTEPSLPLDEDAAKFIVGSARRALDLDLSFSEYIFVEKGRAKAKELDDLKGAYPAKADRIKIDNADANAALRSFCASRNWKKCRAVVFLDPFGNQVEWATIEAIAATQAIDLWYLFPAGHGVHRQIARNARVDADKEASLTRLYGTPEWKRVLISEEASPDLFGAESRRAVKTSTPALATEFMIKRMKAVFKGGVLDEWLVLGRKKHHSYSLIFAWANPSVGARKAGSIARAVMRSGEHGRTK
jgi:three-Cys-motif partner protein